VREALRERPDSFASFATAYSRCPSAAEGGRLGQLTPGQTTPEFEAALAALAPGEISGPVETPYGYHLVRLERREQGRQLPYDAVSDRIATYLRDSVRHRAEAQYIARLVSSAEIAGIALAGAETHNVN
jgi:peptidyl-prolyl cis-trans isomerase C